MINWWRRATGPQQKQASPLMTHVMNLTGHGGRLTRKELLRRLRPRTPITRIDWDGCMATVRRETGKGIIVGYKKHEDKYDGIVVRWSDGVESWQPLDYVRLVGDDVEVWW